MPWIVQGFKSEKWLKYFMHNNELKLMKRDQTTVLKSFTFYFYIFTKMYLNSLKWSN